MFVPLVAVLAVVWFVLLVAAPLLPVPLAAVIYVLGSHICHQRPERSFHVMTSQLPVCARCLGIYGGAAAGALLAMTARRGALLVTRSPRLLLSIGAIPTAVTLALEWSSASGTSNVVRAAAGAPLGCAVALVVARAAAATVHYGGCALRRPIANSRPSTPI